jgi:hypothetical protein
VIRAAAVVGLGLAVPLALSGCGLVTLMHDSVLGPVSPIGRINAVTVGSDFRVTESGPVADLGEDARLRPTPRDMIRRIAMPSSYWALAQGLQAFVTSFSPLATRATRVGRDVAADLPAELRAELRAGVPVGAALALLGPPDVWVRRSGGSFMVYRGVSDRAWSFYAGVPPIASLLVPIPGISNARFSYRLERERASKLMLFFDERDALVGTSASVEDSGPFQ